MYIWWTFFLATSKTAPSLDGCWWFFRQEEKLFNLDWASEWVWEWERVGKTFLVVDCINNFSWWLIDKRSRRAPMNALYSLHIHLIQSIHSFVLSVSKLCVNNFVFYIFFTIYFCNKTATKYDMLSVKNSPKCLHEPQGGHKVAIRIFSAQ